VRGPGLLLSGRTAPSPYIRWQIGFWRDAYPPFVERAEPAADAAAVVACFGGMHTRPSLSVYLIRHGYRIH
jgi:hypothetical protein